MQKEGIFKMTELLESVHEKRKSVKRRHHQDPQSLSLSLSPSAHISSPLGSSFSITATSWAFIHHFAVFSTSAPVFTKCNRNSRRLRFYRCSATISVPVSSLEQLLLHLCLPEERTGWLDQRAPVRLRFDHRGRRFLHHTHMKTGTAPSKKKSLIGS